jgi:O-antigen ligase
VSSAHVSRGREGYGPIAAAILVAASLALLAASIVAGAHPRGAAVVAVLLTAVVVATMTPALISWHALVAAIVAVILFIPIRRYSLPGELPIDLEPYRLVVALVLAGWFSSLLVDRRVRWRRTPLDKALLLILLAVAGSLISNPGRVSDVSSHAVKQLFFFLSFILLFFLIVSVIRTPQQVRVLVNVLVVGGTIVAVLALVERRSGYNAFDDLARLIPFLQSDGIVDPGLRDSGRLRVLGSSEHPIALGALFVMLLPLAMYLARATGHFRWWAAQGLFILAAFASASRTAIVMLLVVGIIFVWLRPRETLRLWPVLVALPIIIHAVLPGAMGTIRQAFLPSEGLLGEQTRVIPGNELLANGRLADIGPTLDQVAGSPFFGIGFGTRVVGFDQEAINAAILDNQWLATLLETGILGLIAWLWLMVLVVRLLARSARTDDLDHGWLATSLAASLGSFAVGMFFFDALGFVQVAFVFFVLLALAAVTILRAEPSPRGAMPVPLRPHV